MTDSSERLQQLWEERQASLGNTQRAVLCKNFPDWLNGVVHNKHRDFVLRHLPDPMSSVLDVGCGYGRLANEIKSIHPNIRIDGIELCEAFAKEFSQSIGECFHGSLKDYQSARSYDLVLIVTILMYFPKSEIPDLLAKLWEQISNSGRLICIEQYCNALVKIQRSFGSQRFSPTGGHDVVYFDKDELLNLLLELPGAQLVKIQVLGLLPIVERPVLHTALAVEKQQ